MKSYKFTIAEQHLNEFKNTLKFLKVLNKERAEEIVIKTNNFDNLRTMTLSKFLEQIQILTLENLDIEYCPPKEKFEEVRILSKDLYQYQNFCREYIKILEEKLQKRTEEIMNVNKSEIKRGDLFKLKEWLFFMPDVLKNFFLEKIEDKLRN